MISPAVDLSELKKYELEITDSDDDLIDTNSLLAEAWKLASASAGDPTEPTVLLAREAAAIYNLQIEGVLFGTALAFLLDEAGCELDVDVSNVTMADVIQMEKEINIESYLRLRNAQEQINQMSEHAMSYISSAKTRLLEGIDEDTDSRHEGSGSSSPAGDDSTAEED